MNAAKKVILELLNEHRQGLFAPELVSLSNRRLRRMTIYVHLSQLQDDGLIRVEKVPSEYPGVPDRSRHHITERGGHVFFIDTDDFACA